MRYTLIFAVCQKIRRAKTLSKLYLTPKEANARLKEIVREKAWDYPVTITKREYDKGCNGFIDFAIEVFEKDHNVIYLPE